MKNNILHITNTFRNADPEALKKAVTQKIQKLINQHIKKFVDCQ